MYQLTDAFIPQWTDDATLRAPARVDTICPHCGLSMVFDLHRWTQTESGTTASSEAHCTSCGKLVSFFASTAPDGGERAYFMHPSPDFLRQPLPDISRVKEFDEALQRAYAASINVYNAREWTGTAVVCRRTLEDIAKALLPSDQRKLSLALQIEALPRRRDLARPMMLLSDALKRSGSLGAFFDLEKIPDRHTATLIIDLLEYLIQYLFILPQRIEHLHNEVRALAEPPREG
jgi:hypothetical protein